MLDRSGLRDAVRARAWLAGLAVVLMGSAWLAWGWAPGQHASPDSAIYLDAARHLANGDGYVTSRIQADRSAPAPISAWPPGFPLLMAAGMKLGLGAGQAAGWILFASYIAFGALGYGLMLLVSGQRGWPLAASLTLPVLLHPATLRGLDAILTDLPFAALATAFACLTVHLAGRDDPSPRAVVGLGLLAGATVLLRWAGAYWVAAAGFGFLVAVGATRGRTAVAKAGAAFGLGLGTVVAPWFARNLLQTGALAGSRRGALSDPLAAAGDAAEGIFSALNGAGHAPALVIAAVIAFTAFGLIVTRAWRDPALLPLLGVAVGYPALMIASWSLAPFDPLSSERFWLPLWPVGAALFIATLTRCAPRRRLHLGVGLAGLALAAPTTLSFALAYAAQRPAAERETGLADPVWARSAPVRFLEESGVECTVVASEPRIHLVHNTLPVVYLLPTSRAELSPFMARRRPLCLVYLSLHSSRSAERRRPDHLALLRELEAAGLAHRVAEDAVGEVWLAKGRTSW